MVWCVHRARSTTGSRAGAEHPITSGWMDGSGWMGGGAVSGAPSRGLGAMACLGGCVIASPALPRTNRQRGRTASQAGLFGVLEAPAAVRFPLPCCHPTSSCFRARPLICHGITNLTENIVVAIQISFNFIM